MAQRYVAIGLMSGTSMDGIDAALITTDGERVQAYGEALSQPYPTAPRERLRAILGGVGDTAAVSREITMAHARIVKSLLEKALLSASDIDVIGFHGHTILHRPQDRRTWQIGEGPLLAQLTGIDVVSDFRQADVAAGGEGAPFAPLYHAALAADLDKPLAVLNLGGVGNVTWIGADDSLLAFDTGPGNALIDDWMRRQSLGEMDVDGATAAAAQPAPEVLATLLDNPYFDRPPPKSLDRDDFDLLPLRGLDAAVGAATLVAFTVEAVAQARAHFPAPVGRWLVCGGGRHNGTMMRRLADALAVPVEPVEAVDWQGDVLEAQAFAFLAVRSLCGLPLSLPGTTGVPAPQTGGTVSPAPQRAQA